MVKKAALITIIAALFFCTTILLAESQQNQTTSEETKETEIEEKETPKTISTPTPRKAQPKEEVPTITCIAPKTLEKGKRYWYARKDAWMKNAPTADGQKIYRVKENSVFVQLEKPEKGWIKLEGIVNDTTKVQGYIYKAFLKPYPPTTPKTQQKGTQETKPKSEEKTTE